MEHHRPDDPPEEESDETPEDFEPFFAEEGDGYGDDEGYEGGDIESSELEGPDFEGSESLGLGEDGADETRDGLGREVLAANEEFYRSLEALEPERMDAIWLHADWVSCVHPGWPMLTGWKAVRESWKNIFDNTETIRFDLSNVGVRVENATAWVTCLENILHLSSSGVAGASAVATNIFIRTSDGWRLVLHHASPFPDSSAEEE